MKKLIIIAGLILLVGLVITGCYRDVIKPGIKADPNGPPQPVSFKDELSPMFNNKCAAIGCHVSGYHKPYLTPDVSYYQLVNGGYVNTSIPDQSELMIMLRGEMGQYMPSASDQQKVYDWIRNGAPNN
ncbi:MAG TPA: hypothetical protein PLA68_01880 [Panacibacter sp.]|nr:hypothetical protein [Panacibacter sp.]